MTPRLNLLALIVAFFSFPAFGQPMQCAAREDILRALADGYGEVVTATGINYAGRLVEVVTSMTGSWTIIVTQASGPSCIVTSGQGWVFHPPVLAPKPDA